jgi:hypothetical protein
MQKLRIVLLGMGMLCSGIFVTVKAENLTHKDKNVDTEIRTTGDVDAVADMVYKQIAFDSGAVLSEDVFQKAYTGYLNLKSKGLLSADKKLLSVADFSRSANEKRLWVIDLAQKKVLFHTLVAHGQGTGEEFAHKFSNRENSHESSLGFYVTDDTYIGHNGYSLKLSGMDKGYNDHAYDRAIVLHGAGYVSQDFIKNNQRLGRSWGCPAVPVALAKPIINTIKDITCLYIYYPDQNYFASSRWLQKPSIPANLLKGQHRDTLHHTLLAEEGNASNSAGEGGKL